MPAVRRLPPAPLKQPTPTDRAMLRLFALLVEIAENQQQPAAPEEREAA